MSHERGPLVSHSGPGLVVVLAGSIVLGAGVALTSDAPESGARSIAWIDLALLGRTLGVALAIGCLATLFALPGAWLMRSLGARWVLLGLAPMLVPMYLAHAAWSLARAPGTPIGNLLEGGSPELWRWANLVQAILSLALWAWPISMLIVGARATRIDRSVLDALRVERAGPIARGRVLLGLLAPAIAGSIGIVALLMLGSAVPLHVAQIETYSIVVWRRLAESPSPAGAWLSALPLLGLAIGGGWLLGGRLLTRGATLADAHVQHRTGARPIVVIAAALVWGVSIILPIVMLLRVAAPGPEWAKFIRMEGESIALSAGLALIVAAAGLLIVVSATIGFSNERLESRLGVQALALRLWIILALVPGVLIGSALTSLASVEPLAWIAETHAGVAMATVARFGAVGVLTGWWLARSEPRAFGDLRALYANAPVRAWWRTCAPLQAGAIIGAALVMGLFAFHEIEATVIVAPAGVPALSQRLLSLLHYLRDDQLAVGVALISGVGLVIALLVAFLGGRTLTMLRRMTSIVPLLVVAIVLPACDRRDSGDAPASPRRMIGSLGTAPGQFFYPRAIDASGSHLWVIDKTGRVQSLRFDGEPEHSWVMPATDRGKPTGLTVGPDGLIYVADTHEHRVSVFEPTKDGSGHLVRTWGGFGEGPGQFIFPTDVVLAVDQSSSIERIYVSEFGGNDRVSVFDASGAFLFAFGAPGYDPDPMIVRFSRPQSIMLIPEANELLVADAANHRLGRFSLAGEPIEWIGAEGGMPGWGDEEFSYPYGLARLPDGTVLVAEYGSNRVQHLDLSREPGSRTLATLGAPGRADGQFVTPWGVAARGGEIFVLDSGNNRIQVFNAPRSRLARAREDR